MVYLSAKVRPWMRSLKQEPVELLTLEKMRRHENTGGPEKKEKSPET